jgi:S-adenosylmethionine:tRNA ribosyltransferase-isomerase
MSVVRVLEHPRLVRLRFDASAWSFWEGVARDGRPIQYAHVVDALKLREVWTPIAGPPAAFEPPSAGFALDWRSVASMRDAGIGFATLTHAAGLSSTGDPELDARLPFDEPYAIAAATAHTVERARALGSRIVAVGTTVVRALEHAAMRDGVVRAGRGLATQRIGRATRLGVVDAIVTGTHESGSSHYDLLRAFADERTLHRMSKALEAHGYRTHEFGDSILLERRMPRYREALRRTGSCASREVAL